MSLYIETQLYQLYLHNKLQTNGILYRTSTLPIVISDTRRYSDGRMSGGVTPGRGWGRRLIDRKPYYIRPDAIVQLS